MAELLQADLRAIRLDGNSAVVSVPRHGLRDLGIEDLEEINGERAFVALSSDGMLKIDLSRLDQIESESSESASD